MDKNLNKPGMWWNSLSPKIKNIVINKYYTGREWEKKKEKKKRWWNEICEDILEILRDVKLSMKSLGGKIFQEVLLMKRMHLHQKKNFEVKIIKIVHKMLKYFTNARFFCLIEVFIFSCWVERTMERLGDMLGNERCSW